MCDETSFETERSRAATPKSDAMTRRELGREASRIAGAAALVGAVPALAACTPADTAANPAPVLRTEAEGDRPLKEQSVGIATPDGLADAHFVHPAAGAHAAVLVWPDAFGLRPGFRDMARRLAAAGYSVLTINPYYRLVKGDVLAENDPRGMASFPKIKTYYESVTPAMTVVDAKAMFAWLDAQPAVDTKRLAGSTGYCMGGSMVFRTAAALPDRIGAGCSFHGGRLVTDAPDSPHRLIPGLNAELLVAIAEDDDAKAPTDKTVLAQAFAAAGRKAAIEVYAAPHGWMPPDTEMHDPAAAEKGWMAKLALFERTLKARAT